MAVTSKSRSSARAGRVEPGATGEGTKPGGPDPAELASQATQFIKKAASILEKEVAAGIVAAQSLEKRVVDVDRLRNRSPDEVMQRFRQDAHAVVDVLMDLLAVGVQSAERISEQVIETARSEGAGGGGRKRRPGPNQK